MSVNRGGPEWKRIVLTTPATKSVDSTPNWAKEMGFFRRITFWALFVVFLIGIPVGLRESLLMLIMSGQTTTSNLVWLGAGLTLCLMAGGMLIALWLKAKDQADQILRSQSPGVVIVDQSGVSPFTSVIYSIVVTSFTAGAVAGPYRLLREMLGSGGVAQTTKYSLAISPFCVLTVAELIGLMHYVHWQYREIHPKAKPATKDEPAVEEEVEEEPAVEEEPTITVKVTCDNLENYFVAVPGGTKVDQARLRTVIDQLCNDGFLRPTYYPFNSEDYLAFRLGAFANQLPQIDSAHPGPTVCDLIGGLIERELIGFQAS